MNEPIPINAATIGGEEVNAVNARELHKFLENGELFTTWIKNRIEQFGFLEGQDFTTFLGNTKKGRPRKEYLVSINMAKELCMVERNAKGKEARLYFIECERKLKEAQSPALPNFTDPAAAAIAWAEQYLKAQALESKVKEDAPKVDYYDRLQDAPGEVTITRLDKLLGIQRKRLLDWLRQSRFIYGTSNTPYQQRIEQGFLVLRNPEGARHSDGTPVFSPYAHVTSKGASAIYRGLRNDSLIQRNPQMELSVAS